MAKIARSLRRFISRRFANSHDPLGEYPTSRFRGARRVRVNLAPYLRRFAKKGFEKKASNLPFKVYCDSGRGYRTAFRKEIYHDTDYSFVLVKRSLNPLLLGRGRALACVGLDLMPGGQNEPRVSIRKIQGVKGREGGLKPVKWERMLVALVLDWAKAHRFKAVEIQPGEENGWCTLSKQKQFHMRYDVTAKRLGFVRNERGQYECVLA